MTSRDSDFIRRLNDLAERIRGSVLARDFDTARGLVDGYIGTVADHRSAGLDAKTILHAEHEWDKLTVWVRDAAGKARDDARADIARLTNVRQYTPGSPRTNIFNFTG